MKPNLTNQYNTLDLYTDLVVDLLENNLLLMHMDYFFSKQFAGEVERAFNDGIEPIEFIKTIEEKLK